MKRSVFQFKLRTWMQLGLLPTLAGVAAWIGWDLYGDLREIILEGFDKQLTSPSVVTAAFIDPTEHQWLAEDRNMRGLAYNEKNDGFYALADTQGQTELVRISATDGTIKEAGIVLQDEVLDLATDHRTGRLLGLIAATGELGWIGEADGTVSKIEGSPQGIREIADGPVTGGVWLLNEGLSLWDSSTRSSLQDARISLQAASSRMGGLDPNTDRMLLFSSFHNSVLWQSLADSVLRSEKWAGEVGLPEEVGYDLKRERWVLAQERLRLVNFISASEVEDMFGEAYGREDSEEYRRIIEPVIRLHDRLGLSFLYTQMVEAPDRIIYVIDAPESGTYSPLLSEDVLPATEVEGVTRLKALGTLHFTGLQRWDQWGWLKAAFAPIFDDEGQVVAMAGTDFNASVIEDRTRQALLAVFVIGGIALVAASAWSLVVSRRLRRPIEELKSGALAVAAGDFRSLNVHGSREVNELAMVFNQASAVMKTLVENLTTEVNQLLQRRDRAEVSRVFLHSMSPGYILGDLPEVEVNTERVMGWGAVAVKSGERLIWWEDPAPADSPLGLKRFCALGGQVGARFQALLNESDLPTRWPENVRCVLRLDPVKKTVCYWTKSPGDSPVRTAKSEQVLVGFEEPAFDLKITGYQLREVTA